MNASLLLVQAGLPLIGLWLFKEIVDAVVAGTTAADIGEPLSRVAVLIALAALVAIATIVTGAVAAYSAETLTARATDAMFERLHENAVRVDYGYYEDPRYFNTLHRAQAEAPYRPTRLLFNLMQVVQSAVTSAGILILVATVHPLLPFLVVLAAVPALALRIRHGRRLHEWQRENSAIERQATYVGWLMGDAEHAKEVRIYDLGSELRERFRALRTRIRDGRLGLARARSLSESMAQGGATLVVFMSYGFIAFQTLQGQFTVGELAMFFGAVQRGQSALQGFFSGLGSLYEDNLFLSNVDEFLELRAEIRAPADPKPVPRPLRQGLVCRGVSFRYPGSSAAVLSGVDLEVAPGEVVAIVGANGSGKTTLVKLLCRLYDPTGGGILLEGRDIREYDPLELRRQMALVFQDFAHFHLPVRDNIWFGDVRLPPEEERIRAAARKAGAHRAIDRLARGYDTVLGRLFPDGEELSIGEWQKVALARAFHSDAQILIVDEPTSALDAQAEAEVFRAIAATNRQRATLVISHRLSTVRIADRIHCLEGGRIVETGDHEALVRRGGIYAQLFASQEQMGPTETKARGIAASA